MAGIIVAVAALGRTAEAQTASSPPSASTLKAFPCPAGDVDGWTARLRIEFQNRSDVRIAADRRSGQILVQAPEDVQAQIAARLAAGAAPSEPVTPRAAPVKRTIPPERMAPQSTVVRLQRQNAKAIEGSIAALLGSRMAATTAREAGGRSYTAAAAGGSVQIDVQDQPAQIALAGPAFAVEAFARLIRAFDAAENTPEQSMETVALERSNPATVRRTIDAIAASGGKKPVHMPLVVTLFQKPEGDEGPATPGPVAPGPATPGPTTPGPTRPAAAVPTTPGPGTAAGTKAEEGVEKISKGSMIGSVQVEMVEGLDVIILRGHKRDVEQVAQIIRTIESLSTVTEPAIEIYYLKNVDCGALTELIAPLYDQVYALRQGFVSINALVKPNAIMLVGRKESVQTVMNLIKQLDRPVDPQTQFQVYRLKHASSLAAQQTVLEFFTMRGGLGPRVWASADFRSNALIVQACPRDQAEVAAMLERLDTDNSLAVNELRVYQLQNSLAEELAPILQAAVSGQQVTGRTGVGGLGQIPGLGGLPTQGGAQQRPQDQKSSMLRFITIDSKGKRTLESGILTDVRINADTRANALLVSAPTQSMELLEALINQLDKLPAAEAQIKVFTIINGDASSLADMLQTLFVRQAAGGAPAIQLGAQLGSVTGDNQVVTLRFAVDVRTNSIIASGTPGDLQVVEAILLRLDDSDVRHRKSIVYRLKNAPALDVSNAINQFLTTERQVQQVAPGLLSPFEQIEREVVVVPEPVSNSLIVSATPRYFDEIKRIVEELDQKPPMVMIQVLIAEVSLRNTDEFGVELGLQDSVLFDRSLLGNIVTTTHTTYDTNGNPASQNQEIVSATYTPGFAFNNQPLGQSSAANNKGLIGSQGISNFSLGRTNTELGYGGLVLSASSESISALLRALKECRRMEVLSRPQVMTLDNQPAFIQVGQRVPRITGTTVNQTAQVNNITLENVGLILGVTPRISPEGLIVMEIDAEKSEVGPEAEGIPVSISATGQVIRSPRIDTITTQTTVSASDGQTIVLGGLIVRSKNEFHRKVPLLGDIPVLGAAFRYDGTSTEKRELLIIMTPHIVRNESDAEAIKRTESARMHWCLSDVLSVHGKEQPRPRSANWSDADTEVIYPDANPSGQPMLAPTEVPAGAAPETIIVPKAQSGGRPIMAVPGATLAPRQRPAIEQPPEPPTALPANGGQSDNRTGPGGTQLRLRSAVPAGDVPAADPAGAVQQAAYTPPVNVPPACAQPGYPPPGNPPAYPPAAYAPPAYAPPAYQPPAAALPNHAVPNTPPAPQYVPPGTVVPADYAAPAYPAAVPAAG